jgi:hypothetical protein
MEYLGQIIIFLSVLVSLRGKTWSSNSRGFKRITFTGYITILCAFIGLIISCIKSYESAQEYSEDKKIIENTKTNTDTTNKELLKANNKLSNAGLRLAKADSQLTNAAKQIDSLNKKLLLVNVSLDAYKSVVQEIKNQSDRQDQTVMMQFVQLRPRSTWTSRSLVFSGSIVEFYGFEDNLLMTCGYRSVMIPKWDGHAVQTVVMGENGRGYQIIVSNEGDKSIMGKIHVISSPRIRSTDWSWIEEKLKAKI